MNDIRANLPSASSLARLAACPGSFRLSQGLPDTSTPESDAGTRIHAAFAGEFAELTPDEVDTLESLQRLEAEALNRWRSSLPEDDGTVAACVREWRMWLELEGAKAFSGQADVIHILGCHGLILDAKTGWGEQVDSAGNLQLRSLAVLLKEQYPGLKSVTVGILQPASGKSALCCYTASDLEKARLELLGILDGARTESGRLATGDHCKYCRALAVCPAAKKEVETFSMLTLNGSSLTVSDADMAKLLARCGPATKMIEGINAECKRRCEANPDRWRELGFELTEGAGRRTVTDVATVGDRLNAAGASWQEITSNCTITIGNVEALARKATGAKGVALKNRVGEILDGCTETKKAAPSLKRIGGGEE